MNKFQYAEKINANTKLSFAHKALLNQIISFQLNNQDFHGTDEYLASTWGVSPRTIQRQISDLKKFNLIQVKLDKKKHSNGAGEWYNKRYITINFDILTSFLEVEPTTIKSEPILNDLSNDIQPIESSIIQAELIPEIEDKTVFKVDDDIDDEAQDLWFKQQIESLTITPKASEPIIVNDDEGYSEIQYKLANGTIVFVPNKFVKNWSEVVKRKRVFERLKMNSTQFGFERELKEKIEQIISENQLMAKYY
jgi:hypothetical protein